MTNVYQKISGAVEKIDLPRGWWWILAFIFSLWLWGLIFMVIAKVSH